jgi:hypothetical protein
MRRIFNAGFSGQICLAILAVLFMTGAGVAAYGQSLGDVARENREKKAAETPATPPKVLTNADLQADSDGGTSPPTSPTRKRLAAQDASARKTAAQRAADQRAAEQWKKQILTQKRVIADLEGRVNRLKEWIRLKDPSYYLNHKTPNPDDYQPHYADLGYNHYEAWQLERLKQMQQQLNQERQKLEDLQEAARHAGMNAAVYDP